MDVQTACGCDARDSTQGVLTCVAAALPGYGFLDAVVKRAAQQQPDEQRNAEDRNGHVRGREVRPGDAAVEAPRRPHPDDQIDDALPGGQAEAESQRQRRGGRRRAARRGCAIAASSDGLGKSRARFLVQPSIISGGCGTCAWRGPPARSGSGCCSFARLMARARATSSRISRPTARWPPTAK